MSKDAVAGKALPLIGKYTFDEYIALISDFHNYPAPGLIVGGFMVEMARRALPEGVLFDAISEASSCLPDAVQLLTPCTAGNGWLRIVPLDRYAVTLFNKFTGEGVRVHLDPAKLGPWPEIRDWYLKRKTKKEQDSDELRRQMREAGESILTLESVQVLEQYVGKSSKGPITVCPLCSEAYPESQGAICLGCQGSAPTRPAGVAEPAQEAPQLNSVPVDDAVGHRALHDMTRIDPGIAKGPEFSAGQEITAGDVCRLQQMGRMNVYVDDQDPGPEWVHENEAAEAFVAAMCSDGSLAPAGPPREGKITLAAARDGLFTVDRVALEAFNLVPDVMCASRHDATLVRKGDPVAGTRAIPLYLSRENFRKAATVLERKPPFTVAPLRKARAGLLITGTEVFKGLIQDRFAPTLTPKIEALGGSVLRTIMRPDDRAAIAEGVRELLDAGCDLIVTTAGLSVDPDDVTRAALSDAGVTDMLFGMPVLPGAMTLVARIGEVQVLGVPACALFFRTTSFDLLLPRLLAGREITRSTLAAMGHGAMCRECDSCAHPHCPFGK